MADVNLFVEVKAVGLTSAIATIDQLRKSGQSTAATLQTLQNVFQRVTTQTQTLAQAQRGTRDALTEQKATTDKLTESLRKQEQVYRDIATLSPKLTAQQRLTQFGGTNGLAGGLKAAAAMERYNNALSASPIQDRITVERQLAALEEARISRLSSATALQRANADAAMSGLSRQAQAQQMLTRATQEYVTAQANLRNAPRITDRARNDPEEEARRLRAQAQAIDAVTAARVKLTAAEADVRSANEARLQQSYGYFILAGLATKTAEAILGVGEASLSASMKVERSFADVERTFDGTNAQLESLRAKLTELSVTTPNSIVDLSQIATLGNQLGIAAADIEDFTTTIAQYTAVSGQSAEDSATAFGRISNLTGLAASQYRNLASAITYTARTTVATESTIQNTAKEISALSAGAGFSAQAIVGLAGALSSLAIPPERARGALSLYFGALNTAVAEGGPKLAAFATLTNMTAETLGQMVRDNRGQEVFQAFISGLSQLDTVAKTSALDTLGLSTIRVDQTMRALAQNVPLVTKSFEGANDAFQAGTEIGDQYAIIQDTLNSQWLEFQNAILNVTAAIGDEFNQEAKDALHILTGILAVTQEVAKSPLGQAFLKMAGFAAVLIAVMAGAIGLFALWRASLVVLSYTIAQMGWTSATTGLMGWVAALVSSDKATRAAALSQVGFRVALSETTGAINIQSVAARAGAVALNLLKVALPLIAITAAIALFTELADTIDKTINPSKTLTDDLTSLKEAIITDNPGVMSGEIKNVGQSASKANPSVSEFNNAILSAIGIQKDAENQFNNTNGAIDAQSFKLGDASKAWIAETLKTQEDLKDIIDGKGFWEQIGEDFMTNGSPLGVLTGNDMGGDELISRDQLEKFIEGGYDINALSQIAIEQGDKAALAAYEAWKQGYQDAHPGENLDGLDALTPRILNAVGDAYGKAAVDVALAGNNLGKTSGIAVAAAADFDTLGNYVGDAVEKGEAFVVTFSGVTGTLQEFRDSIQGAIQGYVGFDAVMKRAQDTAQAIADARKKKTGKDTDPLPVDLTGFSQALVDATTDATTFYNNINALADTGATSFASQLSALGPESAAILAQSLDLDPAARATLETNARFAAFLASDAFKNALEAEMSDTNEAYARIFQTTGNLADVQSYIAAQVAGTGAEWERQWDINHPTLPLNVTPNLVNPTQDSLDLYSATLSGEITITPTFAYVGSSLQQVGQQVKDNITGQSITLPASLDGNALSASIAAWRADENSTPEEIEATLNTDGFNKDITEWSKSHGPITVYAHVIPVLTGNDVTLPKVNTRQQGGYVNEKMVRGYANGSHGVIQGPGTNTSDSIWAKVSMGERIFAADRERFWGHSFMDSLDKKMLPVQFVSMLASAASVSGNSGPKAEINVQLINPVTRDPLKQLRESSEMVAAGIFGSDD